MEYLKKLKEVNAEEYARINAELEDDARLAYNTDMEDAEEIGILKGKAIGEAAGEEKAKIELAKNMLKKDIKLKDIMDITGLTQEEITLLG